VEMNLPNSITVVRIFLVPVFLILLLVKFPFGAVVAAAVFTLAALTDSLDGYLARRNKQVTDLGKILDPLADKLLVSAALIALVEMHKLPSWIVVLILGREFAITGLRAVAASKGLIIAASKLGKWKTLSQIVAIIIILTEDSWGATLAPTFLLAGRLVLVVAVVLTLWSGIDYWVKFWRTLTT